MSKKIILAAICVASISVLATGCLTTTQKGAAVGTGAGAALGAGIGALTGSPAMGAAIGAGAGALGGALVGDHLDKKEKLLKKHNWKDSLKWKDNPVAARDKTK